MTQTLFSAVELAPRDPILGLTEAFNADNRSSKVNLGVGVYYDDNGKIPLLGAVREAEKARLEANPARGYLPIEGVASYNTAVQQLLFGAGSPLLAAGRVATFECLGGTGGLKVGADFLRRLQPGAKVWISDPSWENHRALFEAAGFAVQSYPYYDSATHGVAFEAMIACLQGLPANEIVVLHACCHNPTGVDLSNAQWARIVEVVRARGLIAFLDCAYQGFGDGIDADAAAVRRFADAGGPVFVSTSFSKSLSLYGERIGALSVVADSAEEAQRVLSQLKRNVRTNYSNPPTHGGKVAAAILTTPELRAQWEKELGGMRERIRDMRRQFVEKLKTRAPGHNFDFVMQQRGMFSYSGLTKEQVTQLREKYSVYAVDTGRICVAALNSRNIDYVVDAIARVIA